PARRRSHDRLPDPLQWPAHAGAGRPRMNVELAVSVALSVISAATPLLLAATGELLTEKSGVLNLGVEGMMLVGAVIGFGATLGTGSAVLGVVAAAAAGA